MFDGRLLATLFFVPATVLDNSPGGCPMGEVLLLLRSSPFEMWPTAFTFVLATSDNGASLNLPDDDDIRRVGRGLSEWRCEFRSLSFADWLRWIWNRPFFRLRPPPVENAVGSNPSPSARVGRENPQCGQNFAALPNTRLPPQLIQNLGTDTLLFLPLSDGSFCVCSGGEVEAELATGTTTFALAGAAPPELPQHPIALF
jgi:hypothetical protein